MHTSSQKQYGGSTFQKYDGDDDEAYEMIQEPTVFPHTDDSQSRTHQKDEEERRTPASPTFSQNVYNQGTHASTAVSTHRPPSNRDSDYIKQLTQKIKKQAEQLHELGNYKIMCEKRILELSPDHSLPVQSEHTGNLDVSSIQSQLQDTIKEQDQEINHLRLQLQNLETQTSLPKKLSISDDQAKPGELNANLSPKGMGTEDVLNSYNILYGKYKALLGEKQNLEESLHNETLVNEEQRTYIEILKQMMDEKLDQTYITRWFSGLPERGKIDALIEIKALNEKIKMREGELQLIKENFQANNTHMQRLEIELHKMNEKNQELNSENLKISEINIRLSQSVKTHEAEIKNLEEEKTNLLDFVDESSTKQDKIMQEYNELVDQYNMIQETNQNLVAAIDSKEKGNQESVEQEVEELLQEKRDLEDKYAELQERYEDLMEANEQMTNRHNDIEGKLNDTNEEKKNHQSENKRLKEQISKLESENHKKAGETERIRHELKELGVEHTKLNDMLQSQGDELQEKVHSVQSNYKNKFEKLEKQLTVYKEKEDNLRVIIEDNNEEIKKIQKQLSIYKEKSTALETQVAELNNFNTTIIDDNDKLRNAIEDYMQENTRREDDRLNSTREFERLKHEYDRSRDKVTELDHINSTLEKRLNEKQIELMEYENIMNESKKRGDRDRQNRLDEMKKLYSENSDLKQEIHTVKENLSKSTTRLKLQDEEIVLVKSHLDKKSENLRALTDENKAYKQKLGDLDYITDQLGTLRYENERLNLDLQEYRDQLDDKNSTQQNFSQKLEETEHELLNTLENMKEIQLERSELLSENVILKNKIEEVKIQKEDLVSERTVQDEKIIQHIENNRKLHETMSKQSQDHNSLLNRYETLEKENQSFRVDNGLYHKIVDQTSKIKKDVINRIRTYVSVYNEMIAATPDVLVVFGKKFKNFLDNFERHKPAKEEKDGISGTIRIMTEIDEYIDTFLGEIENLGRKVVDIKQNLVIGNQRVTMLERKCMSLSTEETEYKRRELDLRKEIDGMREERLTTLGSPGKDYTNVLRMDKEKEELRKEVDRLQHDLRQQKSSALLDHSSPKVKTSSQSRNGFYGSDRERGFEKTDYEEIFHRIRVLFVDPDLQKLIADLTKHYKEVEQIEREKYLLERSLEELETDYKLYIKKSANLSPSKSSAKRAEIENARIDLNNLNTQASILHKRKEVLLEELKTFETYEKRRYGSMVESEKELHDAKRLLNDLKDKNSSLEKTIIDLKDNVKQVYKEREYLDSENLKLKYSTYKDQQLQKSTKSPLTKDYEGSGIQRKDEYSALKKSVSESLRKPYMQQADVDNRYDYFRNQRFDTSGDSFAEKSADKSKDSYKWTTDQKLKLSQNSRLDESQTKMKLQDRLNQAKDYLSGMKRSYDKNTL